MYLKNIEITNFRNYDSLNLNFNKELNIIYGKNAQGKTNLLESIYVLCLTKSHRSFIDNNLIKNDKESAKIKGKIKNTYLPINLEININRNGKILKIDNDKINKNSDYISKGNIIIFYPDDLNLIKGSPNDRRRFLNMEISQLDSNYLIINNEYQKLLKIRNDYLKKIANNDKYDKNYFDIITDYFIKKAVLLYKMRTKFIKRINQNCQNIFKNITDLDNFKINYKTNVDISNIDDNQIYYNMKEKLNKMYQVEIKLKTTLIGPHRDDFEFLLEENNLKFYGSQGQQRLAILSLKLSEIEIFKKYKKTTPILLLDDVFSELDQKKKNKILKYIRGNIQTIITTTDLNMINKKIIDKSQLIEIESGKIKKIVEVK